MSEKENPSKGSIFKFIPAGKMRITFFILLGVITGLGLNIFFASNAVSYLSDDPETCINCHVMTPQYLTWERSSHGQRATCNDCHVPQNNVVSKYLFKASDGLRHATYFTFRLEEQVIQIKDAGKNAVQENCIRCHENNIHPVALRAISNAAIIDEGDRYCWDCHRTVPHGRVNSLSSVPYVAAPKKEKISKNN